MMAEAPNGLGSGIILYGNGAYYGERVGDASRYAATRDVTIAKVEFVCSQDHVLDTEALIVQHASEIQELARRHLAFLQIEMLPGSLGEPVDDVLIADIIESGSGWHLLCAIAGACHGYPLGERGTDIDAGFMPRVATSNDVQAVLKTAGVRAIRFMDTTDGYAGEELGPFYFILDRTVLQQPRRDAHFSLRFTDYPTAEQGEAAQTLNREWPLADDAGRDVVKTVVGSCRRNGHHVTLPFREGGAYAYPHPGGGVAWGLEGRYGVIVRGVQRLPADERPEIHDLAALRTIAEAWQQIGDISAQIRDPARGKDLLAAAYWHHAAAGAWLQSATLSDAALIEGQAHLDVVSVQLQGLQDAIETCSADPAWLTGFDAAGWPAVPRQSVAMTLAAFMLQLHEGFVDPHDRAASTEQGHDTQQGRGR